MLPSYLLIVSNISSSVAFAGNKELTALKIAESSPVTSETQILPAPSLFEAFVSGFLVEKSLFALKKDA